MPLEQPVLDPPRPAAEETPPEQAPPQQPAPHRQPPDQPPPGQVPAHRERRRWPWRLGAGLVGVALLAGSTGALVTRALAPAAPAATAVVQPASSSRLAGSSLDVAAIAAAVEPVVVSIQASSDRGPFAATSAGSGIILTADGEVLTNAHVVEGASAIKVTLAGQTQARDAELVGIDTSSDLALLRISGVSGLPTAKLGSSADLQVGDDVVAIGNALALQGGPTVTRGIVSGLNRNLETGDGGMTGLIQTDASISSGNSGGPLVNAAGQIIGINTAVAVSSQSTTAENIGFAIPIDKALSVVERLRHAG
jgi:S1-C subfamily serine protease